MNLQKKSFQIFFDLFLPVYKKKIELSTDFFLKIPLQNYCLMYRKFPILILTKDYKIKT